jgi:hypothetical protein
MVWTWSVAFLPRLITTVIILIAGFLISGWMARNLHMLLARTGHVDAARSAGAHRFPWISFALQSQQRALSVPGLA